MNSSNKGLADTSVAKSCSLNKATALNPNAAEFVPSSLKCTYETTKISDATKVDLTGSSRKTVLDRSDSNTSNNSDDEVHQYWRQRLPDDITPDFQVIGEELHEPGNLSLAGLSINDSAEQSKFPGSMTREMLDMQQDLSPTIENASLSAKVGYLGSIYAKEQLSVARRTSMANVWANIYSETREEARDLARLRNAFFDQARQAYLIGNKALAKELSFKGQLYNMHMKAAHEKAKEEIYRKRNPVSAKTQGYGGEQDRLIDLHGLHVNEALQVLNHELRILRSTARATCQRLHVMICVGTGHHTKGVRTPARLPVAVEQYLLDEGIRFSQPQPGLLSVVIY